MADSRSLKNVATDAPAPSAALAAMCTPAPASHASTRLEARLLQPNDDVATALFDLAAGAAIRVANGPLVHELTLQEDIRVGHKFAVRALAAGLRIRKYGEFIGRMTCDVPAGAWVHVHNLATSSRHSTQHERAWYEQAQAPGAIRALGEPRCCVGESPVFDLDTNRLYWVDVRETPAIHMIELRSGAGQSWPMTEDVGSIALAGHNRLLVALRSGFAFFDCTTGALTPILDPEPAMPQTRLNDGKCDPLGRFWCGSMNPDSGIAEGSLYVLDADLRCRHVLPDWLTPNGMTWSLDGATMFVADTRRGFIHAFAFDPATGTLGERRVFADLGAFPGGPDGATIDCEGYLWSAQFEGGCLIRYAPDGSMERVIRLPVSKPASCAFGGAGYRQLFVSTATRGLSDQRLRAEPLAGSILVLDVGVAGVPPVAFAHSGVTR
ncbi:MAG: SMP-30/gluconolactonase/LRE family protein [Betaproteobacteria bacterium]|nr:SMP-30/gluconolactonase/LRE family protein [Betaproteobacteria bacterium]